MESKKISVYVLALAMALGTVVPLTSSLASAATVTCDPSSLVQVQYGQNSSDVANAQACLVQAGYNIPAGPTGYYGSETEAAVISFYQSWYGAWNGLSIGPKGVAQLQSLVSGSSSNNASNNNATLSALLKGLGLNDQQIAAILAMLSSSSSTSTPTSTSATSTSATSTTPSGNVSVALSSNNQPAGSIIAGAAQNPVLTVTVTNNTSQAVTVTGLTYTKTGVVSDSNITNAYLATGNNIVSQYQSLSNGVLNFSGNLVVIQAGQSQDLTLRVDVGTNANAGNTISFNLTGMTVDSGTLNVTYPYAGNTFTVTTVSNPSLASVSNFVYQGVANSVNAGTSNFRGSAMTMTVNTNPIKIMSVKYTVSGSVNFNSDLQNLVLKIDGNQVASASSTASDGTVLFNIPNGVVLGTGSHTFEVFLNVVGTPNRNFEFQILRPYDIIALDNQYNANISFGTPSGTLTPVNVQQGTVTMTLDSSSPTGNVAIGQSGVTLEKVDVTANGEAVRFLFLPVTITLNGTTTIINSSNIDNQIRNLAVYDSNGNQVGSTLSQLSAASSNCTFSTTGSTNQAICSLGSSSSNINYTIPANTTVVLTVKADIQSTLMNGITSIQASLPAPASNNLQGQISFQGSASQTINGSNLGVTSHPFTGGLNSAYSNQSFVGGISGAHIGSFALSAAAAEGINVSSLTFAVPSLSNVYLQNMKVLINGSQFGLTANTISTGNAYTFSGSNPANISAGGSVVVDVYADILSNTATGTYTSFVNLTGATAVGASSNSSETLVDNNSNIINGSNPSVGQAITMAGTGALSVAVDASNPPVQQLVMGSTGATLAQFRFTANNNEGVNITDITVTASSTATTSPATFSNLAFYNGSTLLGSGTTLSGSNGKYSSVFHFTSPVNVPQNSTIELTLTGSVASYTSSPTSDNTVFNFYVGASNVTAVGASSNASISPSGLATGLANAQNVQRTAVTATLTADSAHVAGSANDQVADLNLTANSAYSAQLNSVSLTFSGTPLANAATSSNPIVVSLIDASNNTVVATSSISIVTATTSATVALTPSTPPVINNGTTHTFWVRVNTSGLARSTNNNTNLSIQIVNYNNLTWNEYGTGTPNFYLNQTAVPLTANAGGF